jgi:CheY-like chemotaxis protein
MSEESAANARTGNLKSILLAEDNPNDVELTLAALDDLNLANRVVVVRDGEEALNYLRCRGKLKDRTDGNPALILLELRMPRVDGLRVLREVRFDEKLKSIPVVILTSSRDESDRLTSQSLGVSAYMVKPVDFHQLIDAVKSAGAFWAVVNEPPPGCVQSGASSGTRCASVP